MIFTVTSVSRMSPPLPGATEHTTTHWYPRYNKVLKVPAPTNPRKEKYRNGDLLIHYPNKQTHWTIEVETLEQLMKLVEASEDPIIVTSYRDQTGAVQRQLEVYDDYRE